jgi:hypothetical protein
VKVNKEKLVELYQAVSYPKADKWGDAKLVSQLGKLQEVNPDDVPKDKVLLKLYKKVLLALGNNEEITLDSETEEVSDKPKMKNAKPAPEKVEEPAEEEAKAEKKKRPDRNPERPGIIEAIANIMKGTSKTNALTHREVLDQLVAKFPDRDEKAMAKTLSGQIPTGLMRTRGMEIGWEKKQGENKRYYFKKAKKEKAVA